jgi:starch-binding outer membrane protein, SusD/RagB family
MKIKICFLISISLGIFLASCNENFLEEEVFDNLAPSNFYRTQADAIAAVSSVYSNFQYFGNEFWDQGNAFMLMADASTNTMKTHWWAEFDNYNYQSTNGMILSFWGHIWDTNNKANAAIGRLPAIQMNEELKSRLIGEAKFLRAYNYFQAVRFWGGLPLILEEIKGFDDIKQVSRATVVQVYDQILSDLNDAIAVLPVDYGDPKQAGRASKGAAKALLGKVYLTRGWNGGPQNINTSDLQKAVVEFEDLMKSPYQYALAENIKDVYNYTKENTPSLGHIFSQQYSEGLGGEGTWIAQNMQANELESAWWGYSAPESWAQGPTGYKHRWDGSTFVPLDKRLELLFEDYNRMMWFHWCKKWQYSKYLGWAEHPQNYIMLRWADVLLMHSEALNELKTAPDNSVVESINKVRVRANVEPYVPGEWTKQNFRNEIQNERNRELWGEGHIWFDYVRKGMLVDRMKAAGTSNATEKHNLYPIPKQEIDNNPNLTQNDGW